MRKLFTFPSLLIFGFILCLIIYALSDGIHYGSTLGVALSSASLITLLVVFFLLSKLSRLREEEEAEA
jgi:hypothetical protein